MWKEEAYEYLIALSSVLQPKDMVPVNRLIHSYLTVNLFFGHIKSLTNDARMFFLNKSQHSDILDVFSITTNKSTIYTNKYLSHTSTTYFGVSHTICRENLHIPYSKPSAFRKLL